jgi:hypothetical protein
MICCIHGLVLIDVYWMREWSGEWILATLVALMFLIILLFRKMNLILQITTLVKFNGTIRRKISIPNTGD